MIIVLLIVRVNTHTTVTEKRKTEKSWTLFTTGCFIKPFKMIINHFFISQAHSQRNFGFLISGISKGKIENGK